MSNLVIIQSTKFINLNTNGQHGDTSYGFRAYDDYDSVYYNLVSEGELNERKDEVFDVAYMLNHPSDFFTGSTLDKFRDMIDYALEKGVMEFNGCMLNLTFTNGEIVVSEAE